jgi:hypothetical protein
MSLTTAVFAWVNIKGEEHVITSRLGGSILNTVLTDVEILRLYLCHMLLPLWLSFFYHVDALTSFSDPRLWISAIFLAGCVGVSLWLAAERRLILLLWCWFFGALLPALNVIPTWIQMQDRYAYFSLPALLLLLALTINGAGLRLRIPRKPRMVCMAALGGVVCLCMADLARDRSQLFEYETKLYYDALAKYPDELNTHVFLGIALFRDTENARWHETPAMQPQIRASRTEALSHLQMALGDLTRAKALSEVNALLEDLKTRGYSNTNSDLRRNGLLLASGILIMRLGNAERGRELIQYSLQNKTMGATDKKIAFLALAELHLQEKRGPEAFLDTQKAADAIGASDPEVLYWRGRAFEALGDRTSALLAYHSILPGGLTSSAAGERIQKLTSEN